MKIVKILSIILIGFELNTMCNESVNLNKWKDGEVTDKESAMNVEKKWYETPVVKELSNYLGLSEIADKFASGKSISEYKQPSVTQSDNSAQSQQNGAYSIIQTILAYLGKYLGITNKTPEINTGRNRTESLD